MKNQWTIEWDAELGMVYITGRQVVVQLDEFTAKTLLMELSLEWGRQGEYSRRMSSLMRCHGSAGSANVLMEQDRGKFVVEIHCGDSGIEEFEGNLERGPRHFLQVDLRLTERAACDLYVALNRALDPFLEPAETA